MRPLPETLEPSSEVDNGKGKLQEIAVSALLGLVGTALIVLYASIGRPLWIDEFLHFAFGGFTSTHSAWHAIRHSIGEFNFGQTGVYMLVDYWLLKLFGANLIALRLPSILSAGLMLWAGFEFLTKRRYGPLWQVNLIACYLGQATLMYYTGEARPYMALAGASVGAFTYYILTPEERGSRSVRILGWLSILWGAAITPIFCLLLAKSICLRLPRRSLRREIDIFLEVCNLPFKSTTLRHRICHLFRDRVRYLDGASSRNCTMIRSNGFRGRSSTKHSWKHLISNFLEN